MRNGSAHAVGRRGKRMGGAWAIVYVVRNDGGDCDAVLVSFMCVHLKEGFSSSFCTSRENGSTFHPKYFESIS